MALDGERLLVSYNDITTPLEHWHYDTFSGMKAEDDTFEDQKFTFRTDVRGFVSEVISSFEPAVDEIVFERKPDARYFDPEYLERFVGDYSLQEVVVSIGLQGNTLTLRQPGAPLMELVPVLGDEFALRQAKVVTLKFLRDGEGDVTAVEVRQPTGIYTLERVE